MSVVTAVQGDTLDAIAQRIYPNQPGVLEQLIELNPATLPMAILPEHTPITVPDSISPATRAALRLWD